MPKNQALVACLIYVGVTELNKFAFNPLKNNFLGTMICFANQTNGIACLSTLFTQIKLFVKRVCGTRIIKMP